MAVYTRVSLDDLAAFLGGYALGTPTALTDIIDGVENSNFLIGTTKGRYILTLFEKRVKAEDLPFFMEMMEHLAKAGIPCPLPVAARDGQVIRHLNGRPAVIVGFLEGEKLKAPEPDHCRQVGALLARMQMAASGMAHRRPNALSLEGWQKLADATKAGADGVAPGLAALIADEMAHLRHNWPAPGHLPEGPTHADLFMDNVFFNGDTLCGVIDFYFACNEVWAYDLAITINAWCFAGQKTYAPERARAMLEGYESVRPLTDDERRLLPLFLRGAALRFLLTRLYDLINHPPGALVKPHDPLEYKMKLEFFRTHGLPL